MANNFFIAKCFERNKPQTIYFPKNLYSKDTAEKWLSNNGINNFLFFFNPIEPVEYGENALLFSGDVGFDITTENIMKAINSGKDIILNTTGGDLFEGWRIHDSIKLSGKTPKIGVIGVCASAAVQIITAVKDSWASENSRLLIHYPWTFTAGDFEDMLSMSNNLKQDSDRLVLFYSGISGKTEDEIRAIMKPEQWLFADQALELKLINEIKSTNQNDMTKEDKEKVDSILDKVSQLWNKIFPPSPKNMDFTDTNGNQFHVVREEGEIQVGDAAEPDGTYPLENGKTVTIADGSITEIKEQEESIEDSQEVKDLKAKVEELERALQAKWDKEESLKAELEQEKQTLLAQKLEVEAVMNELKDIKSKVVIEDPQQQFRQKVENKGTIDMGKVEEYRKKNEESKKITKK